MADFSVRKSIAELESYHVENIEAAIIVNANESNEALPDEIMLQLQNNLRDFAFNRYPQIQAEDLCRQIGEAFALTGDNIVIGNGSSELLKNICYTFGGADKKIMVPVPSFSMYGVYVQLSDSKLCTYSLDGQGYIDKTAVLEAVNKEQPDMLFICNPNNPTGNFNSRDIIEEIVANVKCLVVLDEAYIEFADGMSAADLVNKYENVICLRTFSKAYGLAGMRCGYGIGRKNIVDAIKKGCLPYGVNAYTLMLASQVYKNKDLYIDRIKQVKEQRKIMSDALQKLGFYIYPTQTNFVTFYAKKDLAAKLSSKYVAEGGNDYGNVFMNSGRYIFEELEKKSILVRDYSTNKILQGYLRVSVGTLSENKIILEGINEICERV